MEKETLKSLRAKAKELRSKVSSAPLSKATPDQLRSEIVMLERAVKAEEKALAKKAEKEAKELDQKKKVTMKPTVPAKAPVTLAKPMQISEREKELIKREKELAKKEKLLMSYKPPSLRKDLVQMDLVQREDTSDSEDY